MTIRRLRRTVLVVEDDPAIAELISWALTDAGFVVRTAPTLADALRSYDQSGADLVVADLLLPDGLGSELVRAIRRRTRRRGTATLLLSAHPRANQHADDAGADACLAKPFDLDDFFVTVERLLDRDRRLAPALGD